MSFKSKCGNCGTMLNESPHIAIHDRNACPECGSLSRFIEANITDSVTFRERVGLKAKRPGLKRPHFESVSGDDLHRATGQWNRLERVIDRENNRYREEVVDPSTGRVIRLCEEPLTAHQNRGSAKAKAPRGESDS
jgi:DNA-directed RNA polymerase subunit RPC12/RpoP